MAVEKFKLGAVATLLSTELDSLANNATAVATTPYNNVQGGDGGDGYALAEVELVVTYGVAPAANTGVAVWFLAQIDGTNYEDGSASITPARIPDVVLGVRPVTTAQRIIRRVALPQGIWKACVKNEGVGQAMAATGSTLKIRPASREGI